jgi:hypothetical protein
MTSNSDKDNIVHSWVNSSSVDDIADYAARGRRYETISDSELSSAWVQAFKASAQNIHNKEQRRLQIDYGAELSLRGIQPPFDLVRDDMELMFASIQAWMATLTSEELNSLGQSVETDFEAFKGKRDKEQN